MKYALVFATLSLALSRGATQTENWLLRILLASGAICFAGVALAYAGAGPRVFLKRVDGRISALRWAIFWPFHALNFASLHGFLARQKRRGPLVSPITSRVFLGPRLGGLEAKSLIASGASILDVAGELPEIALFRASPHYLSLPVLDACAPREDDLHRGARWIEERQQEGPVYVHCALGHGRSATFVAAFLMQSGRASTAGEAIALISRARPGIGLSMTQMRALGQVERLANSTSKAAQEF